MDEYYSVIRNLPPPLFLELESLPEEQARHVQEIRIRAGQPVQFTYDGRLTPCPLLLPGVRVCSMLDAPMVRRCFIELCGHSVYAYEQQIAQGFFTIPGGNRVGVSGVRGAEGFMNVTSLNLRVARFLTCTLPAPVLRTLEQLDAGLLVAGAPGSGKTTFLRSMAYHLIKQRRLVCVVDERAELMPGAEKSAPNCDVYARTPKAQAVEMALRCMNPQVILCDELGTSADAEALEAGLASGVVFFASVHCDVPKNLRQKPQIARLLQTGAFSHAVFLAGRERPGTVAQMVPLL